MTGRSLFMPILFHERRYPLHKNKEVIAAWMKAIEKYPQPEGLFTTLVDNAVNSDMGGIKVFSAYLVSRGKYEAALDYWVRFMAEYFDIEGFAYEFSTWSTIEEAMQVIGQASPGK
jgi:hypothetical protein